jgi:hypothetical protein
MTLQVFLATPDSLDHEDVILLYVLVDMPAEAAGIDLELLSHRSEYLQYLTTLFGRNRHPDGFENHMLFPYVTPLPDRPALPLPPWSKFLFALFENN